MQKFTLWTLLSLLTVFNSRAQEITIAAARTQAPAYQATGAVVTVRGVAVNGPELRDIRYIQDATGGIAVYGGLYTGTLTSAAMRAALAAVRQGDIILVTGNLKDFRGLLEIDPITALTVVAGNAALPEPVVFPAGGLTAAFAEQYESRLVRLNGLTSINNDNGTPVSSFQPVSAGYKINNNAATKLYVNAGSTGPDGLIGKPAPTGTFDAVGVLSQYTLASAGTAGYQLLPRLYADFLQGSTPNLTSGLTPTSITTTGFTVNFRTQNAGSTELAYGTSPTGPFTVVSRAATTTTHALALTGLTPATIYYVQAASVNATGRSESRVTAMATASLSTGRMRVYFNSPVDQRLSLPANGATYLPNGDVADTLAAYIDRARETVDVSIYNWNSPEILKAVNDAHLRGVRVRVIYEDDNTNVSIRSLDAGIGRVGRPAQTSTGGTQTSSIMHNKFVIIDANAALPSQSWVWTGSTNWTPGQLATDPNNVIHVQDQSLARTYVLEFEEMWGGSGPQPGSTRFGSRKTDNTPHYFNIGGRAVESWFSPTDNVNTRLIENIQTADNDLHVAAMLITQTSIGNAIRNQITAKNMAACSEVLINSDAAPGDVVFANIRATPGLEQRAFIDARPGIMHHKTLLVDAGAPLSDPLVFVGSHNWTLSADTENDENTLVVHDERIVNKYYQEFGQRIADQARVGIVVCRFALTGTATRAATVQQSSLRVYPNPAASRFQVTLPAAGAARTAEVLLRDLSGRVVLRQTRPLTGQELTIEAADLKAGLYLLQVTTAGATQTGRVVVE